MSDPAWFVEGMKHIWLPYAQMQTAPPPEGVASTSGSIITLDDGRQLVDGIASWWSACHGYNHPYIHEAIAKQLAVMPHVMLGGLVHEQPLRLSTRLATLTKLDRVFFSDSGSVAVDIALKIALQYWRQSGRPLKDRFICFRHGYHGDTLGAMSVSDPDSMHPAFRNSTIKQYVVDIPENNAGFAELETLLERIADHVAGMIIEPLVQGAGGMKFHSSNTLAELQRVAAKHKVLFIADEIATGFGRTGSMFACNQAGIVPDILCLGKALSAGTLPLAATLARKEIFEAFLSDDPDFAFMHGPTFMGHALAAAAANASLDLFEREPRLQQVKAIEAQLLSELSPCKKLPHVVEVRVRGAIGVVEFAKRFDRNRVRAAFVDQGCWIRPLGRVIYLTPAFTIGTAELSRLTRAIRSDDVQRIIAEGA